MSKRSSSSSSNNSIVCSSKEAHRHFLARSFVPRCCLFLLMVVAPEFVTLVGRF
jgi:hypothetical protein